MNTLEDTLTQAGDDLRHAAGRMPAMQAPRPQPLRTALAFAAGVAGVLLLVAVPAWLLGGGGSDDGVVVDTTVEGGAGEGDVFMVPDFVPEGFTFSRGQFLDATMRGTASSSEAAGTYLQYLQGEAASVRPGTPSLTIEVTDQLAVFGAVLEGDELECYDGNSERISSSEACREHLAGSTCVGEEAIEAGQLDAEACIAEERESVTEAYGADAEVDFEETIVRGLLAHITTVTSPEPGFISVTTYEGGPVVSIVTGYLVDEAVLLRVANDLQQVGPEEFEEATTDSLIRPSGGSEAEGVIPIPDDHVANQFLSEGAGYQETLDRSQDMGLEFICGRGVAGERCAIWEDGVVVVVPFTVPEDATAIISTPGHDGWIRLESQGGEPFAIWHGEGRFHLWYERDGETLGGSGTDFPSQG